MTNPVILAEIPTWKLSDHIARTRHDIRVLSRRLAEATDQRYTNLTMNGIELLTAERNRQQLLLVALLTEVQRRNQSGKPEERRNTC